MRNDAKRCPHGETVQDLGAVSERLGATLELAAVVERAVMDRIAVTDPDLGGVVRAWPRLTPAARAAVLAVLAVVGESDLPAPDPPAGPQGSSLSGDLASGRTDRRKVAPAAPRARQGQ